MTETSWKKRDAKQRGRQRASDKKKLPCQISQHDLMIPSWSSLPLFHCQTSGKARSKPKSPQTRSNTPSGAPRKLSVFKEGEVWGGSGALGQQEWLSTSAAKIRAPKTDRLPLMLPVFHIHRIEGVSLAAVVGSVLTDGLQFSRNSQVLDNLI